MEAEGAAECEVDEAMEDTANRGTIKEHPTMDKLKCNITL